MSDNIDVFDSVDTNVLQLVIGVTGTICSGKDVLAERAAASGFVYGRYSDAIREDWKRQGIADPDRQQLQDLANLRRREHGPGYWSGPLLELARSRGTRRFIVNGIRNPGEVETLKKELGGRLVLAGITAPTEQRFGRWLKRSRSGDNGDLMDFLSVDDRERGVGQPSDGQQIERCLAMVPPENVFNNAGTLEEFHAWVDSLILRVTGGAT